MLTTLLPPLFKPSLVNVTAPVPSLGDPWPAGGVVIATPLLLTVVVTLVLPMPDVTTTPSAVVLVLLVFLSVVTTPSTVNSVALVGLSTSTPLAVVWVVLFWLSDTFTLSAVRVVLLPNVSVLVTPTPFVTVENFLSSVVVITLRKFKSFLISTVYVLDLSALTVVSTVVLPLSPAFTVVVAAAMLLFNCWTLTASVSFTPAATLVIFWLFAFKPSLEMYVLPPTDTPLLSSTTCLFGSEPTVTESRPLRFLASLTFKLPFSLTTPMLPFESLEASASPPLSSNVWPRSLWIASPESPLKFKPFLVKSWVFLSILLSTTFNWSSVAAWPLVILLGSQVLLVKSLTVPEPPLIVTLPELIVPFVPLIFTALAPSPALMIPVVPSKWTDVLPEPNVTVSFKFTVYVLAFVRSLISSSTWMFLLPFTLVSDAAFTSFNCLRLTASLSSVPALTFLICVLFALKPLFVTNVLPPIVKPLLLIVVWPVVTLFKPVKSFASLTFNLPFSDTTPILLSDNLALSETPPTTSNVWPRSLWIKSPESAWKFKPFLVKFSVFLSILLSTTFNWSSVAAWPLVMCAGSQEMLVKLFTVPFAPLTRTLPALMLPVTPSIATLPALIVLFTPLIVTAFAPLPAFTIPVVPSMLTAVLPEPNVTVSFNATV